MADYTNIPRVNPGDPLLASQINAVIDGVNASFNSEDSVTPSGRKPKTAVNMSGTSFDRPQFLEVRYSFPSDGDSQTTANVPYVFVDSLDTLSEFCKIDGQSCEKITMDGDTISSSDINGGGWLELSDSFENEVWMNFSYTAPSASASASAQGHWDGDFSPEKDSNAEYSVLLASLRSASGSTEVETLYDVHKGDISLGGMAGWVTNAPQAAHLTTNYSYDARVTVLYFNELPPEP